MEILLQLAAVLRGDYHITLKCYDYLSGMDFQDAYIIMLWLKFTKLRGVKGGRRYGEQCTATSLERLAE